MTTSKDYLEMYYGRENQRKKLSNGMDLVEIHIAEWVSDDENWEEGDWFVEGNGVFEHVARCNGYDGADWLSGLYNIAGDNQELEDEIKELVDSYELSGLAYEARDAALEDAEETDADVKIVVTHNYFLNDVNAAFKNAPKVIENENGVEMTFDTYADANEYIDKIESETYYLSHGEAGRPSYRIVK